MLPAIRPARDTDWDAIAALLTASSLPTDAEGMLSHFLVAERDGRLVGCACVEPYGATGLLRSVAVAATERGTGLGRALTERCIARARDEGQSDLVLLTTTAADFFAHLGFVRIDRAAAPASVQQSSQFCGGCCASATAMQLML